MKESAVLLLLNGRLDNPSLVRRLARRAKAVVCADGGCRHAMSLKIVPRFIVGDMDSLPIGRPRWPQARYVCDFDENLSDFEKSLRFCARLGVKKIWVAAALGGRLDHAMINQRLAEAKAGVLDLSFIGDMTARLVGRGTYDISAKRGAKFSLLALGAGARLTLTGARYPLRRETLRPGSRGLSNESLGRARLTVRSGAVWAVT